MCYQNATPTPIRRKFMCACHVNVISIFAKKMEGERYEEGRDNIQAIIIKILWCHMIFFFLGRVVEKFLTYFKLNLVHFICAKWATIIISKQLQWALWWWWILCKHSTHCRSSRESRSVGLEADDRVKIRFRLKETQRKCCDTVVTSHDSYCNHRFTLTCRHITAFLS